MAAQHVDQLRKLVETGCSKEAPDPRNSLVCEELVATVDHLALAAQFLANQLSMVGVGFSGLHCSELVHHELMSPQANPTLPEDRGSTAACADEDDDKQ